MDERTAGPSTALRFGRDDKSEGGASRRHGLVDVRTAGPSTTLRSGRNDNFIRKEVEFFLEDIGNSHNKIVIPTGAQRSGGTCFGFFLGSHADSLAR